MTKLALLVRFRLPIIRVATDTADYQTVVNTVKTQLSESNLSGVLVYALTAAVVLYFFWWAARKSTSIIVRAFSRGKIRF